MTEAVKINDLAQIKVLLSQLGKTPFFKNKKPTPYDEAVSLTWYLENVYVLEQLMKSSGFEVVVASFLSDSSKPQSSQNTYINLKTAKNN